MLYTIEKIDRKDLQLKAMSHVKVTSKAGACRGTFEWGGCIERNMQTGMNEESYLSASHENYANQGFKMVGSAGSRAVRKYSMKIPRRIFRTVSQENFLNFKETLVLLRRKF